ncbi:MAG: hypothetical protein AAFX81_18000 [Pseudomonadota bacterium]
MSWQSGAVALGWLVVAAMPAAALPEGRFATPDREAAAVIASVDGKVRVDLVAPGWGGLNRFELATSDRAGFYEEAKVSLGWFDRMLGRKPDRLPFDGARLAWATGDDEVLVVNSLEVDTTGQPQLRRARLALDGGGLLVELWRFVDGGPVAGPRLLMDRVAP